MSADIILNDQENRITRTLTPSVTQVTIPGHGYREIFYTFRPTRGDNDQIEPVEAFYERVASTIAADGAQVIQEHCFGPTESYQDIALCRNHAFMQSGLSTEGNLCYIGEPACDGSLISAGTQVWAVCPESDGLITPFQVDGKTVGIRFNQKNYCYLSLPVIQPLNNTSKKSQAVAMFREVNRLLAAENLQYKDVVRTWIYIPELLDWYGKFNQARHKVFREADIMSETEPTWLPASTGIQAGNPFGSACTMGALAVVKMNGCTLNTEMVNSPGQCEAFEYGSAFSRAVEIHDARTSRVYVSGTASIDEAGNTIHKNNIEKQTEHTLAVIKDLLGVKGHDFSHITHMVTFLKKAKFAQVFQKVAQREGIDLSCSIETVADVCRDDLLIEIELMTVKDV